MLYFFFISALIITLILVIHITIEINTIEKESLTLVDKIQKHYEPELPEQTE